MFDRRIHQGGRGIEASFLRAMKSARSVRVGRWDMGGVKENDEVVYIIVELSTTTRRKIFPDHSNECGSEGGGKRNA